MKNKIKDFQEVNELDDDGIIGYNTISKMKEVWKIKTDEQIASFLGQVHHESAGFTADKENLNYSSKALLNTFKKYFKTIASTEGYARNPEKIANKVYSNRMGNGDEASGEGMKYRGAGGIQLTGADNYKAFSKWLGLCYILTTEEIADKYFWETGLFYFEVNNLWDLALKVDDISILKLSRAINLGNRNSKATPNGLEDRIKQTKHYYKLIKK